MTKRKETPHKEGDYIERAVRLMVEGWVADTGYVPHEHADLGATAEAILGSHAILKKAIMGVLRDMEPMKPGTVVKLVCVDMDGLQGRDPHPTKKHEGRLASVLRHYKELVEGPSGAQDVDFYMVALHGATLPECQVFEVAHWEIERVQ